MSIISYEATKPVLRDISTTLILPKDAEPISLAIGLRHRTSLRCDAGGKRMTMQLL